MILVVWMLSFKPNFSLFSFTFINRLFSLFSLSAIRVVSSAYLRLLIFLLDVVQSLSNVWLFATPWTAACQSSMQGQAPLSFTISRRLLKFLSIELVMPSNHLILCQPLYLLPSIFHSIRVFSNESTLHIDGQSTGASASASVLLMNIQGWYPLELTGLISLQTLMDTLDALLRCHAWLRTSVVPTTASS